MIEVVNLRDTDQCYRVDRATRWGNPWSHKPAPRTELVPNRWTAVTKYLEMGFSRFSPDDLLELDGHTIGCWCAPLLCHGNALQALVANAKGTTRRWVLFTGEAPRKNKPLPPSVEIEYRQTAASLIASLPPNAVVVHGGAPGVDTFVDEAARAADLDTIRWPADWQAFGSSAGPARNQFMLDAFPIDDVIAIHRDIRQSAGTADMVRRSRRAHLDVEIHGSKVPVHRPEGGHWRGPLPA